MTVSKFFGIFSLTIMISGAMAQTPKPGAITPETLAGFDKALAGDPSLTRIVNAATNNSIKDLSLNREMVTKFDGRFNFELKSSKVIDQKSSGRCWMFAGANTVTPKAMSKLKLSEFNLSQAYIAFYDRLEKSNFFLETMIAMRERPITDRALQMYLENPIGDGGWWQYFEGLIRKYGVVPSSAMPETKQSSSTGTTNSLLSTLLRKSAAGIRQMAKAGEKEPAIRKYKEKMLGDIYRLLICAYGKPPKEFVFRYEATPEKDTGLLAVADSTKKEEKSDKKTWVEKTFTPQTFFVEMYGDLSTDYVAIVHNPAEKDKTLFELVSSRNIFEQPDIRFLNMPIATLKKYAQAMIRDSQIVWFACDVGRDNYGDSGMFAANVWDYSTSLGIDFSTNKADRIAYRDENPNHAMVLLGLDTALDGTVRKWKVENSWGSSAGSGGFWTMYDSWFDDNVLLVMVDKNLLTTEDAALLEQKPTRIEDWQTFYQALTELQ